MYKRSNPGIQVTSNCQPSLVILHQFCKITAQISLKFPSLKSEFSISDKNIENILTLSLILVRIIFLKVTATLIFILNIVLIFILI